MQQIHAYAGICQIEQHWLKGPLQHMVLRYVSATATSEKRQGIECDPFAGLVLCFNFHLESIVKRVFRQPAALGESDFGRSSLGDPMELKFRVTQH
jgi:hypothetical protein